MYGKGNDIQSCKSDAYKLRDDEKESLQGNGIIMTHGDRKVLPQGNKKGIMYGRGMLSPKDMKPRCYIRESIAVRVMEAK